MELLGLSKVFWNFLVFAIIQTVFFYEIVSEFVFKIIDDKVYRISGIMAKQMPEYQLKKIEAQLEKEIAEESPNIKLESKARDTKNWDFLLKKIGPLVLGGLLAFGITFWKSWDDNIITGTDYAVFAVILGSYLTEVGIFFIMMNRYEFIGTVEILSAVNKKLRPFSPTMLQ